MKTLPFLFALFVSATTFAQGSESSEKSSKFILGWIYSTEVSYRVLSEGDQADDFTPSIINQRNENEQAKYGQTFQFFFGYQFASRFRLEAGLGFTDYGEGRKPVDLNFPGGPSLPSSMATMTGTNHLIYSTLPINVQFQMGKGKIQGFVSAGIAPSLLTRYMTTNRIEYADGAVSTGTYYSPNTQEQYTKFILGASISGGIDYRYSEKASLRIAPVFRMTTNSVVDDTPIQGHYFNVGVEFGSVYHL